MGAKVTGLYTLLDITVSIHAPVMGANAFGVVKSDPAYVSIHAPVMGANYSYVMYCMDSVFQSTHP